MSDSKEECKLQEDLWSSFCSVSRFQISGLLIRQASSSAVPAVKSADRHTFLTGIHMGTGASVPTA